MQNEEHLNSTVLALSDINQKYDFYKKLHAVQKRLAKGDIVIMRNDLKAKVGSSLCLDVWWRKTAVTIISEPCAASPANLQLKSLSVA